MKIEQKDFIKKTLKDTYPNLIEVIIIITLFYLLKLNIFRIIGSLITYRTLQGVYKGLETIKILKNNLSIIFIIGVLFFLNYLFRGYELWGLIAVSLFLAIYILIRKRKEYLETMKFIEKQIWGESLDQRRKRK